MEESTRTGRALVVDESRPIRTILARILRNAGFAVDEAACGSTALELARLGDPHSVVLVEANLPGMNGFDLIKELRREPRQDRAWIMVVTGENESKSVAKALSSGADEFLMKPFTTEMVLGKLRLAGLTHA